ncbi:DUF1992 domain-containing protein [Falsihalocynthiibacter sp. SS001]|uniref:DnaJ family domain-containing protein n=1 Tax=Falsihalocynthiibacter sp. SS001 TaxID=3349698 RepID=UPI0036D32353
MSNPFSFIIDRVINKAKAEGEFDNLPGAGKPLDLEKMAKNPPMNTILKNYNVKPPAVVLNQQIQASYAHLKTLTDPDERKAEMKKLADLQLRYTLHLEAHRKYG